MSAVLLTEKYESEMFGVLNCYDRVIISGNLQPLCYAKGMTRYLYARKIRIFDYTTFAEPLRETIRENGMVHFGQNHLYKSGAPLTHKNTEIWHGTP